jgi:hypothetical protein
MSIVRNKLYNSIVASKIDIDFSNIDMSYKNITKQLSPSNIHTMQYKPTIYHMNSLYRNNTNDKYELSSKKI